MAQTSERVLSLKHYCDISNTITLGKVLLLLQPYRSQSVLPLQVSIPERRRLPYEGLQTNLRRPHNIER